MDKKIFAQRFKEALCNKNMSAAELSRITGISEGVISQYKNGKYEPKRDRLELFAKILEVKSGWLSGYDREEDDNDAFLPHDQIDINEVAFRLRFLRENNGLSVKDVANALSISENLVKRREMGDSVGNIVADEILIMANMFHTSIQYIMNWGVDDPSLNAEYLTATHSLHGLPDQTLLAIVGKVLPGVNKFEYHDFLGYISEDLHDVSNCFFFRQNNESMEKEIRNGDYVLIQKDEFVEDGKLGLVCIDGADATIRKFIHRDDAIILQPFNIIDFDPVVIPREKADCLKVVGRVLYSISRKKWDDIAPKHKTDK